MVPRPTTWHMHDDDEDDLTSEMIKKYMVYEIEKAGQRVGTAFKYIHKFEIDILKSYFTFRIYINWF